MQILQYHIYDVYCESKDKEIFSYIDAFIIINITIYN